MAKPICASCRGWDVVMITDADGREVSSGVGPCRRPESAHHGREVPARHTCAAHAPSPRELPKPQPGPGTRGTRWDERDEEA